MENRAELPELKGRVRLEEIRVHTCKIKNSLHFAVSRGGSSQQLIEY